MFKNKPVRELRQRLDTVPTYTIPEAAEALAIDTFKLFDWYSGTNPILKPSGYYQNTNIALLSFRDIDEAYRVQLLRTKFGYSLQYLRDALTDARKESGSDHPLIDRKLVAFNYLAIVHPGTRKRRRQAVPLGTHDSKPFYIPEVLDTWGKRIVADSRGRTQRIFPWRYAKEDDVSRPVMLDPNVMSGRLVVTGTRIPVSVLRKRSKKQTVEEIASDYGISPELVKKALAHIDEEKVA